MSELDAERQTRRAVARLECFERTRQRAPVSREGDDDARMRRDRDHHHLDVAIECRQHLAGLAPRLIEAPLSPSSACMLAETSNTSTALAFVTAAARSSQ